MPGKNNQKGKTNGYILYAQEIKNELLRGGYCIRNTSDLIAAAAPRWEALPADEKEYYKEKAKWDWENRNATGNYQRKPRPERRDCSGALISDRVDVVKVNEDRRKRERQEVFMSFPKGRDVLEKKFYFLSFICLLEEPQYQPVEVAAVQFSLVNGIEKSWHKFIDPGPIPMGYLYKAQHTSEATHKIPVKGNANPDDTYTRIFDELFHFLSQGTQHIPPIHCKRQECDRTEGCIKWLAQQAGRPNSLRRIYELEGLILDLDSHLNEQPQTFSLSKQVATDLISSTIFDWDNGTRCKWHEENESKDCALGNVNRYSYCIANYFCESFDIQVSEHHLPVKHNEVCYTLIPSHSSSVRTSRYPSKAASRAEPVAQEKYRSEDIANRVAQKLKIEADNRRVQDEEAEQAEIERQQKELEQKKRWMSLRGGASTASNSNSTNGNENNTTSNCNNNATTTSRDSVIANQPSPVSPETNNISKPVTKLISGRGRGRGRGVMNANLRRPGEAPRIPVPGNVRTEDNRALASSGGVRPPPGLWAGTAPPPQASEAPAPPQAWMA